MRVNSINFNVGTDDNLDFHRCERENGPDVYVLHIETDVAMFATKEAWRRIVFDIRAGLDKADS